MINYSEIAGGSGKNFVFYKYKNKKYKCSINQDGTLEINVEHKIRRFDFLFFIGIPTVFQCLLFSKNIFLFLAPFLLTMALYLYVRFNKEDRQFHAAEHKVINALENGLDLQHKNIINQPSYSYRCGGNQVLSILIIALTIRVKGFSIYFAIPLNIAVVLLAWKYKKGNNTIIKTIRRFLQPIFNFMQKHFTTLEPENKHIEAAMLAMKALIAEHNYK